MELAGRGDHRDDPPYPGEHDRELELRFGSSVDERRMPPAGAAQKKVLADLSPDFVTATALAGGADHRAGDPCAGERRGARRSQVVTENGWFAARLFGTEDVYNIYAESFRGAEHLRADPGRGAGHLCQTRRSKRPAYNVCSRG